MFRDQLVLFNFNYVCLDIDECTTNKHKCRDDEQCRNNEGSYTCVDECPAGLTRSSNNSCIGKNSNTAAVIAIKYTVALIRHTQVPYSH